MFQITTQYIADAQAGQRPEPGPLLARYPQYADAIMDFIAYYHTYEEPLTLMSRDEMDHPLLCITASGKYLIPHAVAHHLNISIEILEFLEQRKISPQTIPQTFYVRIASLLEFPVGTIRSHISAHPFPVTQKSKQRQVAEARSIYRVSGREQGMSFREAIAASSYLSSSQKEHWYAILTQEHIEY